MTRISPGGSHCPSSGLGNVLICHARHSDEALIGNPFGPDKFRNGNPMDSDKVLINNPMDSDKSLIGLLVYSNNHSDTDPMDSDTFFSHHWVIITFFLDSPVPLK